MRVFRSEWISAPRQLPAGTTIVAIGDVHGCLDEVRCLVEHLGTAVFLPGRRNTLVFLGDLMDRGPSSLATLDFIGGLVLPRVATVRLLGNHDLFLRLIVGDEPIDTSFVEAWLDVGGLSTFRELGGRHDDLYRLDLAELRGRLRDRLGNAGVATLAGLVASHRIGEYLFVHAGIDPALPLDALDVADLVSIREPFLSGVGWQHDLTAIHGHTIRGHEVLPHRVAVDTGAFRTGILSAVQLECDRVRWIAVTAANDLSALAALPTTMPRSLRYEGPLSPEP